jgi:hypothetical protein
MVFKPIQRLAESGLAAGCYVAVLINALLLPWMYDYLIQNYTEAHCMVTTFDLTITLTNSIGIALTLLGAAVELQQEKENAGVSGEGVASFICVFRPVHRKRLLKVTVPY